METIRLDLTHTLPFVSADEMSILEPAVETAANLLHKRLGPGSEFLGWLDWPRHYDKSEFQAIKEAARRIRRQSKAVVVIGIGGSYLGARATIEALGPGGPSPDGSNRRNPDILFAGYNLSPSYHHRLIETIGKRDFSVIVISKSGTTTEPALAFRLFRRLLIERYGKAGASERIYAITDRSRGALRQLAEQEGYTTFVVPDDIGGRYSVLTPVGLLPIAVAGVDINALIRGAAQAMKDLRAPFADNPASQYAAVRNILYRKGFTVEMLVGYEPALFSFIEWWKQLFGESEGKDGKGLLPTGALFTTDLHSLGQYIQQGRRLLFETVLDVQDPGADLPIEANGDNHDGLDYLAGKSFHFVNQQAMAGTIMAHVDGGVPNILVRIPTLTAWHLGYLFYFFKKACAISGYLLGVNPFDQPGVEAYKRNMFKLLGKPS